MPFQSVRDFHRRMPRVAAAAVAATNPPREAEKNKTVIEQSATSAHQAASRPRFGVASHMAPATGTVGTRYAASWFGLVNVAVRRELHNTRIDNGCAQRNIS